MALVEILAGIQFCLVSKNWNPHLLQSHGPLPPLWEMDLEETSIKTFRTSKCAPDKTQPQAYQAQFYLNSRLWIGLLSGRIAFDPSSVHITTHGVISRTYCGGGSRVRDIKRHALLCMYHDFERYSVKCNDILPKTEGLDVPQRRIGTTSLPIGLSSIGTVGCASVYWVWVWDSYFYITFLI